MSRAGPARRAGLLVRGLVVRYVSNSGNRDDAPGVQYSGQVYAARPRPELWPELCPELWPLPRQNGPNGQPDDRTGPGQQNRHDRTDGADRLAEAGRSGPVYSDRIREQVTDRGQTAAAAARVKP